MNLSSRAMLVELHISQWSARKTDKRVNREVAANHGTSERAGNYNKSLVVSTDEVDAAVRSGKITAADADALRLAAGAYQKIKDAAQKVYDLHVKETLPWSNEGSRILLATNFMHYSQQMREGREEFEFAVNAFVPEFPTIIYGAKAIRNGLFNEADYPGAIRSKYGFETLVLPMPAAQDFRVDLDAESTAAVKASIEDQVKSTVEAAAADAWNRLRDVLVKMHHRLSDPDAVYRDTLFSNVEDVLEVLPRLNILGDPCLDAAIETVRQQVITPYSPAVCRSNLAARAEAASRVDAILSSMAGFAV